MALLLALCTTASACSDDASSNGGTDSDASLADRDDAGASGTGGGAAGTDGDDDDDDLDPSAAKLSFLVDGEDVDFAGKNNASYYQENFGQWRLVVVVNDVLGDKYFSIKITAAAGEMVSAGEYDCTMEEEDEPEVELSFRRGAGAAEESWEQAEDQPCSITIDEIGEVGGRLKGGFSATLVPADDADGSIIELSSGSFDVERKDF